MSVRIMSLRRDYTPNSENSFRSRHSREGELEEIWRNWNGPPSPDVLVRPNQHRSSDRAAAADLPRFEPGALEPAASASAPIRYHHKPYPRLNELPDNIDTTSLEYGTLFGPSVSQHRHHQRSSSVGRPPARPIFRHQTYPRSSPPGSDSSIRCRSDDYAYINDNPRYTTAFSNPPSSSLVRLLNTPPDQSSNNTDRALNSQSRNLGTRNDSLSRLSSISSLRSGTNPSNTVVPGLVTECSYDSPEYDGCAAEEEERYYQERIRTSNRFGGPPRDIAIVPKRQQQPRLEDDPLANLYPKDTQTKRTNDNDGSKDSKLKGPSPPPFSAAPQQLIEISPGTRVHLRGAVETWQAVQKDFYMPCQCFICGGDGPGDDSAPPIFCIQDAEYVLCPLCKSVSPLEATGHGVGLGFTTETLAELQADMQRSALAGPLPPAQLASHRDDRNGSSS